MGEIYEYIISISIAKAFLHIKTEVVIKMCFAKILFLLFLVNQEQLLVVSGKCFKHFSNVFHETF